MKIFTNDSLRAVDKATIESGDATSMQLIEQVAEQAAVAITARWKASKPTAIFAGPGNNGADALALARLLCEAGFRPQVYLFNIGGNRLSADCRAARDMLVQACPDVAFTEIVNQLSLPDITSAWLVIDGLFGSGLRDNLSGGFLALVRRINESEATVVSLDVPSGLRGDWNPEAVNRDILHATLTLTVGFPRIAFFFGENDEIVGSWQVLPIGLSDAAIRTTPSSYYYVERHDVRPLLRPRHPFVSKADLGSAVIVGGSYGMAGAPTLAARAALRCGCGKVTVHGPRAIMTPVQTAIPEAMFRYSGRDDNALDSIDLSRQYHAIAVGPGLGTADETVDALERLLKATTLPMVIDADAINCIARRPSLLNFIPRHSVLTPHAGEFDRLFGQQPSEEVRLLKATEVSRRYNIIIVLKGHYTAVIRPDGRTYFNSSGTPALATAGSGDVLTGAITALMAQGLKSEMAAVTAVYLHGVAGSIAARTHSEYGVIASDIADALGQAIAETIR